MSEKESKQSEQLSDLGVDLDNFSFANAIKKKEQRDSAQRQREATKLVRVQISSNNKNKVNLQGEIFSVRNAKLPEIKKFVPFNKPTHIPKIMLNMLREKKCQMFREERRPDGNKVMVPYLIPEYNIQELPPLTPDEFNAIKQRQLAEGRADG